MQCLDENALQALARGILGARDLESAHRHLDVCPQCRRLAAEVAADDSLHPQSDPAELSARGRSEPPPRGWGPAGGGQSLGRFLVIASLGQGGMGQVLLAYDAKLDRKVALKRVRTRGSQLTPDAQARLLREAQAMARLSHPNVLTVHDASEIGGEVIIAMEYVEGQTLRRWLEAPRGWREILATLCAAGEGLAAAHRAGLVHRDFKPDNVLVGHDGRARVTDFGLARQDDPPGPACEGAAPESAVQAETLRTETSPLSGTPGYIAPEALEGRRGPLSDQFSFFVSLWEALYGERPFGSAPLGAQLRAAQRGHVRPAPRGRGVPKWLRRLVLVGLSPAPEDRFPSMADALAALRRASQRSRRARRTAAAVVALAGIAAPAIWLAGRPARICAGAEQHLAGTWDEAGKQKLRSALLSTGAPQAEATFRETARVLDAWAGAWTSARTRACVATKVEGAQSAEAMERSMGCLDLRRMDFEALVRRLATAGAVPLEHAVAAAASLSGLSGCEKPTSPALEAPPEGSAARAQLDDLRRRLAEARAHQWVRDTARGLPLAEEVARRAGELALHALRAEALLTMARLRDGAGDFRAAEDAYFEAAVLAQAQSRDDLVAEATSGLMFVGGNLHRFDEAHRWERLAKASLERAGLAGQEQEARFLSSAGAVHFYERSLDRALEAWEKALVLRERLHGPEHVLVADALYNLSLACAQANRHEDASRHAARALGLYERLLGAEHRKIAPLLNLQGKISLGQGRVKEAAAYQERALQVAERSYPTDHPHRAFFLEGLGLARLWLGDLRGAETAFESALANQRQNLGEHHRSVGVTLGNLGWVATLRGDYRRALEVGEEVARRFPDLRAEALGDAGEAHRRSGDLEEAQRHLEQALEMLSAAPDARVELQVLTRLAECELSRGAREKARDRLERALALGERERFAPQELAQTRFALARALSTAEVDRAGALARDARAWFEMGRREAELQRADRFLANLAAGSP